STHYTAPSPLAGSAAFSCRKRVPVPRLPPSIQNLQQSTALPSFSSHKPLYIIPCTQNLTLSTKPRRKVAGCHAYEADKSQPQAAETSEAAQKLKIGLYFATWWALNVVFNIYNKKVLNAFPYPWLTSTLCPSPPALLSCSSPGPQGSLMSLKWVVAQSVFYHMCNQVSCMSLDQISPFTFSIGNTMKRISVIVSSILIFHTPIHPTNAVAAAIAILGTFLYSQAKQ
ncbi:glucose-6-phosphate/phosphate translocator 1, chloroplastic-like, partial [Arachis ipaensis]|uniref:glucose-6-phosphate/phosphate translocator 1, chloroplastic-like n=1 Tax=Arachis ipaensis TaxID=130454 RepID=UPI000A2B7302